MSDYFHSGSASARYRVCIIKGVDSPFEGIIELLADDYDGCDGLCTYGCGVDPWELVVESHGDSIREVWEEIAGNLPADIMQIVI